jgi:hypothetical protein
LTLPHLGDIEARDWKLGETLRAIMNAHNTVIEKTGVSDTPLPAPPNIRSIAVTAQNGQFNIVITDPDGQAQQSLGLHYFLEWATDPSFPPTTTTVEDIGPARGESLQLGNVTLYWRAYSQFRHSAISKKIVFGAPTAVVGGGNAVPPPPGGGSGGSGGGGGFGGGSRFQQRQF